MKASLFAFGVLLACVCTISYADYNVDFLASIRDTSSDVKDILTGLVSSTKSSSISVDNIFNCGFSTIADVLESATKDLVSEASSCDPSKSTDIQNKLTALLNTIPQTVSTCLQSSSDAQSLLTGLHVAGLTQAQVQAQVTSWIENNPLTACWDLQGLQSDVENNNWSQFGSDAGSLIISIFTSKKRLGTHKDHFTQIMTGIASNVQEAVDVGSLINCSDEPTYTTIEAALLPLIDEAASCDPTKYDDISQKAAALVNSIPDTAVQCISQNPESQKLISGLGISGLTPDQIQTKITNYVLSHILSICSTLDRLNKQLKNSDFQGFGTDVGKLVVDIFKSSNHKKVAQDFVFALMVTDKLKLKAVDTLADLLGGLASVTTAKGADVKTTAKCTDEPTAGNILSTLADLIGKSSTCDLSKATEIAQKAKALVDGIPDTQKQCLNNDPAAKQIVGAFGIAGSSIDKLMPKIVSYAIGHFSEVCNTLKVLNSDATGGNWNQFGVDAGKLIVKIFTAVRLDEESTEFVSSEADIEYFE